MLSKLNKSKFIENLSQLKQGYTRLERVSSENNGVLSHSSEFREFDCSENFKDIVYSDYNIVNLLNVGALRNADIVTLGSTSNFTFVDDFSKSMSHVQKLEK